MRTRIAAAILLASIVTGAATRADDVDAFVDSLNASWIVTNYAACLSNINDRLSTDTNDLPALVAKSCYYVFVDADFPAASNVFDTADPLIGGLSGTNAAAISALYEGLRDDIRACLSVPMTNAAPEVQKQYIRDALYPTNYPEQKLLLLLGPP